MLTVPRDIDGGTLHTRPEHHRDSDQSRFVPQYRMSAPIISRITTMYGVLSLCTLAASTSSSLDVSIDQGHLRGEYHQSLEGSAYVSFRGIPYAAPPVGALRFRPPEEPASWSGVRDASQYGSNCVQLDLFRNMSRQGSEDCLFLDVNVPADERRAPRPVLVWIHGGGFFSGSGDDLLYGPDYLMDSDVILVTINYRLNVLGFFTTADAAAPGNYGLFDQVKALQWVQRNIGAFGGDADRVTIFGQSAGASSVSLLVLSPLAKGLFQGAISQSGSALAPWVVVHDQSRAVEHFTRELHCSSVIAPVDCLRRRTTAELMDALERSPLSVGMQFAPRIDIEADQPFLPDSPERLLETGRFNRVPRISGLVQSEGSITYNLIRFNEQTNKLLKLIGTGLLFDKSVLALDLCSSDADATAETIRRYYTGDASEVSLKSAVDALSDRFFVVSSSREIELASKHVAVYKYVLDQVRGLAIQDLLGPAWSTDPDLGVNHLDDIAYLFRGRNQTPPTRGSPAHAMIRRMVTIWTNFASKADPTAGLSSMPRWPAYTALQNQYISIGERPTASLRSNAFQDRLLFWQSLPENQCGSPS